MNSTPCTSSLYRKDHELSFRANGWLKWQPRPEKFLLMHCSYGRVRSVIIQLITIQHIFEFKLCHLKVSNRIRCFRKALLAAGLLNRTLIVVDNPKEIVYGYERLLLFDVKHTRLCLGEDTVITSSEFLRKYNVNYIEVDKVVCIRNCPLRRENGTFYIKWWKSAVFSHVYRIKTPRLPRKTTLRHFLSIFLKIKDRILFMGDLYFLNIFEFKNSFGYGDTPFLRSRKCPSTLSVQPSPILLTSAKHYVKEKFNGERFLAVHLRRGDFSLSCEGSLKKRCGGNVGKFGVCVGQKMKSLNISNLFLATDGRKVSPA